MALFFLFLLIVMISFQSKFQVKSIYINQNDNSKDLILEELIQQLKSELLDSLNLTPDNIPIDVNIKHQNSEGISF